MAKELTGLMNVKKGDTVVMLGFTGIRLADVVVSDCDKKTIDIETKKNGTLTFDRKTGVQQDMAEGKEKYANKLVHPDDAPKKKATPAPDKKSDKKEDKKASDKKEDKKAKASDDDDDDEEEKKPETKKEKAAREAAEAAEAAKKAAAKKGSKKPSKKDDDEEYEEV